MVRQQKDQVIWEIWGNKNITDYTGDYPGVCSTLNLDFYLENCPDPNLLLKIKH